MSNQLDRLLDRVQDALDREEEPLWQPDLTDVALPAGQQAQGNGAAPTIQESRSGEAPSRAIQPTPSGGSGTAPRHWDGDPAPVDGSFAPAFSPALLEQMEELDQAWDGIQAIRRAVPSGGSAPVGSPAASGGTQIPSDPAARGMLPLAAAAAAAGETEQARAVDRAFQRDSRRYDRGFSLY